MKKVISLFLAVVLLSGVSVQAANNGSSFSDVPTTHWAYQYIEDLAARGVINGYPDGKFYPGKTISREEFAKMLVVAAGLHTTTTQTIYDDVSSTSWSSPYIATVTPYIPCYPSTNSASVYSFHPKEAIIREDVAVATMGVLDSSDLVVPNDNLLYTMFEDANEISDDAAYSVALAVANGIINGYPAKDGSSKGTFGGQRTISRAEAAAILWRAIPGTSSPSDTSGMDADNLVGTWETDQGCLLRINSYPLSGYYSIEINWWAGTAYNVGWTYDGEYNADLGYINCYHGTRKDFIHLGMMAPQTETIYSRTGTGKISILNDGTLKWENYTDDMAAQFPDGKFIFRKVS